MRTRAVCSMYVEDLLTARAVGWDCRFGGETWPRCGKIPVRLGKRQLPFEEGFDEL